MIHRFGADIGLARHEDFGSVGPSFRTDIEQQHSLLQIHDNDSNDLQTARRLADEVINISGALVVVYVRTENADLDTVWDADPDPTYWTPFPIKAYFKPEPLQIELKKWGADIANKTEISFSHRQIHEKLSDRMLRVGDVIQVPYNAATLSPKNFRITNAAPSGNFRYHWMYLTCAAETLTADITVRPEPGMPLETPIPTDGRFFEGP